MNRATAAFAFMLPLLASCGDKPAQVTARAIVGYDAAAAAELAYLESGSATPKQAVCLKAVRRQADAAVKAVDQAGGAGSANAQLVAAGQAAVDALQAAATGKGGC